MGWRSREGYVYALMCMNFFLCMPDCEDNMNKLHRYCRIVVVMLSLFLSLLHTYHGSLMDISCSYSSWTNGIEYHIPPRPLVKSASGKITWLASSVTMMFRGSVLEAQPHLLLYASLVVHLCNNMKMNKIWFPDKNFVIVFSQENRDHQAAEKNWVFHTRNWS